MDKERKYNRLVKGALVTLFGLGALGGVGYALDWHNKPFYTKEASTSYGSARIGMTYQLSLARQEVSGNLAVSSSKSEIILRKGPFDEEWCYTANHHFSDEINNLPVAPYLITIAKNKTAELIVNTAVDYANIAFDLEMKVSGVCKE